MALTAVVVAAGIGMVAAIGQRGDTATWSRWSDVGQAFGAVNSVVAALAVVALVLTSVAQSREHRIQQAEVAVRRLHITLTRMAIDNPHPAQVWPRSTPEDPVTQSQYRYANLLLQHAWLQYTTGIATREELTSNVRYLFASPVVREFWSKTADSRHNIYVEDTRELSLARVADEILREYSAVLACSSEHGSAPHSEGADARLPLKDPEQPPATSPA